MGELGEAARAAGRPLEAAVAACPVLEDGLGLGSLLGALRQRPAPDRWERWQLHALADDLARSRAEALAQCLGRHPLLEGQAAAREWLGERPAAALRRASRLAHQVEVGAPPSLALIALAVRTVGDAVDAR